VTAESKKLQIHIWGSPLSPSYNPRAINIITTDDEKVKEVYSGENHVFVKKESKIFAVGLNYCHQISDKNPSHYF
jgi:hypothetical protein